MASGSSKLLGYKLDSDFCDDGNTVIHKTYILTIRQFTTWRTEEKLGAGAFGVVWRQREARSGRLRAVKIISKLQLNVRELEALVALQDRADLFVTFFGWYEDPHATHIAMEYIEHGDLGRYIKDNSAKAKGEVKEITSQILRGLVVLHERGICHRDLKPQNVLIASISPICVKIADFGISKRAIETSLRTSCGTTAYRAPEQLGLLPKNIKPGRSYTNAVDIWALGVVVHEILTSEIPFLDTDRDTIMSTCDQFTTCDNTPEIDMELLYKYCRNSDLFPTQTLQTNGVTDTWQDLVKSLMAINPRDRVSAAGALNNRCFIDLELLRIQLGLLLSAQLRSGVIILLLESDLAVVVAILDAFGGKTIQELHGKAIERGYLEVVKLVEGTSYETNFGPDLSSLQLASWHGQINMKSGDWPMWKAAAGGHLDAVKLLIAQGFDVNAAPRWNRSETALQAAAEGGHLDVVKLLLAHGADVNAEAKYEFGRTALQASAEGGHLDVVKLLLAHGADVNAEAKYEFGRTALQASAECGHLDVVKLLLAHGADVNAEATCEFGRTALQAAAEGGHLDVMKLLLAHGADVNAEATYEFGRTALQAAAEGGHLDVVKLLLAHGADVNAEAAYEFGWTALQAAAKGGHLDVVKLLLAHGADVNAEATYEFGRTALQEAAEDGHLDVVKLLLAHGADVNAEAADHFGRTALQAAAEGGHLDVVKLLLAHGADVNTEHDGWTALHTAPSGGHMDAIRLLLAQGVDADGKEGGHDDAILVPGHLNHANEAAGESAVAPWEDLQVPAVKLLLSTGATPDMPSR